MRTRYLEVTQKRWGLRNYTLLIQRIDRFRPRDSLPDQPADGSEGVGAGHYYRTDSASEFVRATGPAARVARGKGTTASIAGRQGAGGRATCRVQGRAVLVVTRVGPTFYRPLQSVDIITTMHQNVLLYALMTTQHFSV